MTCKILSEMCKNYVWEESTLCEKTNKKYVERLWITELKTPASECDSVIGQIKIIINVPNEIQLCEP